MSPLPRRTFLRHSLTAGAGLSAALAAAAQTYPASPAPGTPPAPGTEPKRPAPLDPKRVHEFVVAGHGNLPRVKQMLAAEPRLLDAMTDWGGGDWETALGGASHVGNREAALHLIDTGARFDAFGAAMLGEGELVTALMRAHPALANARGPHGYTLLYHAGHAGGVPLAETVAAQISAGQRAAHFNQALHSAVGRGHTDLVAYLLEQGIDNPNTKNFQGKTALDVALAKHHEAIVQLLRAHGGVTAG